MPVIVPLPFRRLGAAAVRRRPVATQVVAVSTALGASLGLLAFSDSNPAETSPATQLVAEAQPMTAEQAPAEPQHPQPDAQPIAWNNPIPAPPPPHTVRPVNGRMTSGYGPRWGVAHNGIDFAGNMGAPIHAVTNGVVIEAGPASGFGLWVRVQQDDGSIGVYGHMNEILTHVGQPVRAGDVIATVGSRGQSTGPHLHYEVHMPGIGPIDPHPWLAARGIDPAHFPG